MESIAGRQFQQDSAQAQNRNSHSKGKARQQLCQYGFILAIARGEDQGVHMGGIFIGKYWRQADGNHKGNRQAKAALHTEIFLKSQYPATEKRLLHLRKFLPVEGNFP